MSKEKKDKKTSGQNDKKGTKTKRDITKGQEKKVSISNKQLI